MELKIQTPSIIDSSKIIMTEEVQAKLHVIEDDTGNKQYILEDPVALEVFKTVAKHNCKNTFLAQIERVEHFIRRIDIRGFDLNETLIVLLNVNTEIGSAYADILMPGNQDTWQEIRNRGEIPFARGFVIKDSILKSLELIDPSIIEKVKNSKIAVLIADFDVIECFNYEDYKLGLIK